MIISWNWLKQYVDLNDKNPEDVAKNFTITTAEIEDVILPPSPEELSKFKVARIESIEPHPNADKLRCCKVNDGDQTLDIVCGAPNAREGLTTILAPVGITIGDIKIKEAKIRGVKSFGMLCSMQELGVGEDHDGIIELNNAQPGISADQVFSDCGATWDLDNKAITHRPDLWGHYGIGRELAAIYDRKLKELELAELPTDKGNDDFEVQINTPEVCRRYCGLSLKGVRIAPSPEWLQKLLIDAGQKPINNVVDATNFVNLELGQPTHAFDQRRLSGKNIKVDFANGGEEFTALIGKTVQLRDDSLMIYSGDDAVALAGVVGGENSSVEDDTTEVFLEAAHFAPLCIRKTALVFDMRTDSSARFEKSLDPENTVLAIRRIVSILKETCPDLSCASELIDVYPGKIEERKIELDPSFVNKKMGITIAADTQKNILEKLGFKVEGEQVFQVTVPSYRNTKDIEESIDLVEEVGRIYGLDKISAISPALNLSPVPVTDSRALSRVIEDHLVSTGYSEIRTYSFANIEEMQNLELSTDNMMELANPTSKEQTHMRTSLLPRAIEAWGQNAKHLDQFQCFEMGKVFHVGDALLPDEKDEIIIARYSPNSDNGEDLYQLQSDILSLLTQLGLTTNIAQAEKPLPLAHPARSGVIHSDNQELGYIAELHPKFSKKYGLPHRLSFAVIYNPIEQARKNEVKYHELDKFPSVPFSLSLLVPKRTTVGSVMECIQCTNKELIHDLQWVGNYEGSSIPEDKTSMTLEMNFKNPNHTMKNDEIQDLQATIIKNAADHGFVLREA